MARRSSFPMLPVLLLGAWFLAALTAAEWLIRQPFFPAPATAAPTAAFAWPEWARTARLAGAFFSLADTDADLDARLDALVAQNVSVVIADCPWGWSYSAWVDDTEFFAIKALVAKMVAKAHARGLKVVMYQTGLELISSPDRNPGLEHPDWAQKSLSGQPVLFNDISSHQAHWLTLGQWDMWVSPCSGYRTFTHGRVREVVATGVDGLWIDTVYLCHSIGVHLDLWPSTDPCSAAAFTAAAGLAVPTVENWDDPAWRRWIVWRHWQATDYLLALKAVARSVNPNLVFFEENWNVDASDATFYANDPADFLPYADLSTGHEVSTIGDRVDEGQTGMKFATLDQWLSFRTMMAFTRAADRGKPSWILTYGFEPRDSSQLAGMVLAEGANFYETQGPGMDGTVGAAHRTQLFGWMKTRQNDLYEGQNAAAVGLVYSPRNRDLLDSGSGTWYDVVDSVHFKAYRQAANLLYRSHIPLDVVLDTDLAAFNNYSVLILPEVQAMSNATATALKNFPGKLITVGETGGYDEWLNPRAVNALAGVPQTHLAAVSSALVTAADTGLLSTTAPAAVQLGLRRIPRGYTMMLVNTAAAPTTAFDVDLRLRPGEGIAAALLSRPDAADAKVPYSLLAGLMVRLAVPAGIDSLALLTLTRGDQSWLPLLLD